MIELRTRLNHIHSYEKHTAGQGWHTAPQKGYGHQTREAETPENKALFYMAMRINPSEPGIGHAQGSCTPSVTASDFTFELPCFPCPSSFSCNKTSSAQECPHFP